MPRALEHAIEQSSCAQEFHYLWAAPLEAGTILALLATKVDQWMLPALGIVAAVMFSQYFFGYQIAVNKMKASHWVNERCVSCLRTPLSALVLEPLC